MNNFILKKLKYFYSKTKSSVITCDTKNTLIKNDLFSFQNTVSKIQTKTG